MYVLASVRPLTRFRVRLPSPSPMATLAGWWRARRKRQQLLGLNDYMLRDIGLTRKEAELEAARHFWDVTRG
ncbi:MAG: DUF1127 domain-containing protein [Paracoccus sp. (in: a-proteobacteria)]